MRDHSCGSIRLSRHGGGAAAVFKHHRITWDGHIAFFIFLSRSGSPFSHLVSSRLVLFRRVSSGFLPSGRTRRVTIVFCIVPSRRTESNVADAWTGIRKSSMAVDRQKSVRLI